MINAIPFLLCHLVGDFWLQTDWMALNKSKPGWEGFLACLTHVLIYTACFLVLTISWKALLLIGATHFIIDRWPVIINRMIWWKNHIPFGYAKYHFCDSTGYYDDSPYNTRTLAYKGWNRTDEERSWGEPRHFAITIWLRIISDNTLHLIFNYLALILFM